MGYQAGAWSIILSYPYLLVIYIINMHLGGKRKSIPLLLSLTRLTNEGEINK
jgi:hypothetical protein